MAKAKVKKYKLKTNSAAKKRFKVTSTGKIMRRKTGKRHLLEHKPTKTKRQNLKGAVVSKSDIKKIKALLPGLV
jgi:large subunit ribosomal protein L35